MRRLHDTLRRIREEIAVWRLVLADSRTPRAAKWLLGLALAYLITPIDLIPDFIPVLGQLDDVIVVPLFVWAATRLIPREVVDGARGSVAARPASPPLGQENVL